MPDPTVFTGIIDKYLPEPESSLVSGIIFGINLDHKTIFYDQIKRVGLLHIVVLSGMNISLLSGLISTLTIRVGKRISLLLNMLIIIFFVAFVGIQAPILRAAFMSILTSVGTIFGKNTLTIYILILSAICMIIIKPDWLTSISFQLSYAATFGMLLFAPKSQPKGLLGYCLTDLRISIAAQIFTAPIIFLYFRQVSLISPLANLLVSWTIAPIMIFGFLAASLGKIHYALGELFAFICFGLTHYIVIIIVTLSKPDFAFVQF